MWRFKIIMQIRVTFDVIVKNVEVPAGVESVRVPVWSEPDQGDLIWYFCRQAE